ncbi:hypothetical protein GLOTRDRAFT_23374, partial [Gloeophyllum trabeum ATCC 11539]
NLPRLRISDNLMQVFLWVMREAGAAQVPSFDAFRKLQDKLRKESGIKTVKCQSPLGNNFYMNDIGAIIAKDYSNPLTRPLMVHYPHETSGPISEVWHGKKLLKETPLEHLCPHYLDDSGNYYYVNEIAMVRSGNFVIPRRWKL